MTQAKRKARTTAEARTKPKLRVIQGGKRWEDLELRGDRRFPPPQLAQLGPYRWILLKNYRVRGHRIGLPRVIIPRGLEIDGASLPRAVWSYHHPMGSPLRAALIHDARYALALGGYDRALADDEFFHNLIQTGHSEADAWLMWKAVRAFGGSIWAKRQRDLEAGLRVADPLALHHHLRAMLKAA